MSRPGDALKWALVAGALCASPARAQQAPQPDPQAIISALRAQRENNADQAAMLAAQLSATAAKLQKAQSDFAEFKKALGEKEPATTETPPSP